MDGWVRWVVAIVVAAAIVGLIAFARGTPEHGDASPTPAAAVTVAAVG